MDDLGKKQAQTGNAGRLRFCLRHRKVIYIEVL